MRLVLTNLALLVASTPAIAARADDAGLAGQAYTVLKKHCYRCHGVILRAPGLNVLRHDVLVSPENPYVVAGDMDNSYLWQQVSGSRPSMPPPAEQQRPTPVELDILKRWIEAGAERFPPEKPRQVLDEGYILARIVADLERVPAGARSNQRYFTFTHLYNNPNTTDDDLRIYRAALSKAVNSLTRVPQIVLPQAIDPEETIFRIDTAALGWTDATRARWSEVLKAYPYGLTWKDPQLNLLVEKIQSLWARNPLLTDHVPYLRADWFVAKAVRPPIYDALLEIPETDTELEEQLGIRFVRAFQDGQIVRGGVTQSGVSYHNRLVDRLTSSRTAYYYKSYDFGRGSGRGLLAMFPLGPKFPGNEFANDAFEQDGGEIVFSLPNGMQGYQIVDKDGKRIPDAPVSVVRDLTEISGTPLVVNGVSCIGCHRLGIQRYGDNIAPAVRLIGRAASKVAQIYPGEEKLAELQKADTERFLTALRAATEPFLGGKIEQFPEPVTSLAQRYEGAVGLEIAAYELGKTPLELSQIIQANEGLQRLGLTPLAAGHRVARAFWESRGQEKVTVFQQAAFAMGMAVANRKL